MTFGFFLNGHRIDPPVVSMNGTPDEPSPGDIITVLGIPIVLDGPGVYRFRADLDPDGNVGGDGGIRRILEDGTERVVGVFVGTYFRATEGVEDDEDDADDDDEVEVNGLTHLCAQDLKSVRGVSLKIWWEGMEQVLAGLDPERVAVRIFGHTHEGALPPLPRKLGHLSIISNDSQHEFTDFLGLAGLRDLKSLDLSLPWRPSFDLGLLKDAVALRRLTIVGPRLMGTGTLTRLPELRSLTLSHRGLEDVEFVRGMKSLVHLNLRYSGVRDLSPLESVTTLESVVADGCPVERLPFEPMPALRRLRVMSTRLTDEDLAVFRSANPQCVVAHRWGSALHAALEGCDRLRVRTGGTCCRTFTNERTLIELSGKNEVAAIAAQIAIDESADVGRGCMCCCADLTLEFYRGTKLAVSLGVHHGRSLQWPGGWPGEAMMTPACKSELVGWLGPRLAR